uniref:Serine/threonine-protein phosphatase 4 regulatory subunit 3-like central domain-containing protein n=1 Tax=Romanomermis culicivorax TaxID=13658 RepID=A0A915KGQ8_ROMCU
MATTTANSTTNATNNVVSSQSTISTISLGVSGETSTVTPKKEVKDTRRRVKVYVLNEKRTWEDRGTGHVTCTLVDRLQGLALIVRSESDNSIALESKILTDTAYQKQQETLIVWSEGDNCDLALSFQEKAGCEEIWERICQIEVHSRNPLPKTVGHMASRMTTSRFFIHMTEVQGRDPTVEMTQDPGYEAESENDGGSPDNQVTCSSSTVNEPLVLNLPECELSHLSEINDLISSSFATPLLREALVSALENQGYIKKLLELFRMCEDLDNKESLHILYRIMMNIFMLNKNALFEIMFSEDNLREVIGIFEYDPNIPVSMNNIENRKHREYLYEKATFREIIPITNQELKSKIHQTYRVQYIQDCILPAPSIFEENLLSTLSSFIFFNKVEIVSMIQEDEKFLKELFDRLTLESTMSNEHKRDLSAFLKEFCAFSQKLQPQDRDNFFRNLTNRGILKALENLFRTDDDQTRLNAIEILSHVVDYNASLVRDFALQQTRNFSNGKKNTNLLNIVIDQIFHHDKKDPEMAASLQLAGILKILIDPENMMSTSVPKSDKSEFLAFFYKHCIKFSAFKNITNFLHLEKD